MTKHTINIQDGFLFQTLKTAQPVAVELVTGRSLEGRLKRFDRFALVLELGGREVLVYKHAIATVSAPLAAASSGPA
jgi:host factor-I protein